MRTALFFIALFQMLSGYSKDKDSTAQTLPFSDLGGGRHRAEGGNESTVLAQQ